MKDNCNSDKNNDNSNKINEHESELTEMKLIIEQLYHNHKEQPFIRNKMLTFVRQLPNILKTVGENKKISEERKEELTQERDKFINSFFQQKNKQYFYIPNSSKFIKYDTKTYQICNEDDILHDILSGLSKNRKLTSWKYRIKNTTFKMIKDRTIFKAIPETNTIQKVVSLIYPSLFKTKNHAKYFLTIIGDSILKKSTTLIFFISLVAKSFLKEITYICDMYFETCKNPVECFKFKYYDHNYENCRIVDICKNSDVDNIIENLSKQQLSLDFLCVAIHYSNRYSNSENFLENHCDNSGFINKVFYLKDNTEEQIVKQFTNEYICEKDKNPHSLDWNTILFFWKNFLDQNTLPNIMFQSTLKNILIEKFDFNKDTGNFMNIKGKKFVQLSYFIDFWKKCVTKDSDNEYDIDEIAQLFKQHYKAEKLRISEKDILSILDYFIPNIEIIEDKTIQNICCEQWKKNEDITLSLDFIREKYKMVNIQYQVSFYDIYKEYCDLCEQNSKKMIVKKQYFEKFIINTIPSKFIVDDEFLNEQWWKE